MTNGLEDSAAPARSGVSTGTIAALLLALFAADNLLVLRFLGMPTAIVAVAIVVAVGAILALSRRLFAQMPRIPWTAIAGGLAVALVLLILGGEGRFFYANADWQIRDAVLADMARLPWPFAYDIDGEKFFLRAPIGMYLMPALAGAGRGAEYALLAANAVRLGLMFALAWPLFESARARAVTLAIFIVFSGWDIVGSALYDLLGVTVDWDHLESWNSGFQFSSHITQLFWVPQHALAGWFCAVTFLLWRSGKAPIALFAAAVPLVAIWSPLAVIGAVPFAVFAGIAALRQRALAWGDVALAAVAVVTAAGALLYMQTDAVSLGGGIRQAYPSVFIFCAMFEVLPFLYPLLRERGSSDVDRPVLWLVLAFLLVVPFFQIGVNSDLQMRASIMPLAILAIAFARWTITLIEAYPLRKAWLAFAVGAIVLGAVTPAFELRRALVRPPSPTPLCSLVDVWTRQSGMIVPVFSYLAWAGSLPPQLREVPVRVTAGEKTECWATPWPGIEPRPLED